MTTIDPWASTSDLPPDLPPEYHYSHGLTGVGNCNYCGEMRTLFVHSLLHNADDCNPICANCVRLRIETLYTSVSHGELEFGSEVERRVYAIMVRDIYQHWLDNQVRYQHSREEVLAHPQGCQACARFGSPDRLTEATSLQDLSVRGLVHAHNGSCSARCAECSILYYEPYSPNAERFRVLLNRVAGANGRINLLCNTCFNDSEYTACEQCGMWEDSDELLYYEFLDNQVCRVCQNGIVRCDNCREYCWDDGDHDCDEQYATIKSFDFRPSGGFTFHGTDPNNLFLGFELEVEAEEVRNMRECAEEIDSWISKSNRGYLKSDGSLNDGFELVTQPHTLADYEQHFPWDIIRELRNMGFRSWDTDTCGFHVHISRQAFGWRPRGTQYNEGKYHAHLLRFTKLIYDNSSYVTRYVAGRSSSRWASYSDRSHLLEKVKHGHQSNARYSAVNVANTQTIEVRVFKGSLKVERVKAYLQFVHSVAEYTRDLHVSPNENNLMWRRYTGWLRKNEQTYPELVSLITTRQENDNEENN